MHIAIATRDDACLKTADLEARAEAIRYGAQQLRFSRVELQELLGANYRQSTIEQIHALTEGWPVVVQMIHSAAGLDHDIDKLLQGLRADHSTVTAYLTEEVISKLSPELQAFLMDIAIVDRIDTSLADHLRKAQNSQTLFSEARALDALLLPVDSVESSYRLHPVFREQLLERLRRTSPERLWTLHAGAAEWFYNKGDLVEAVRHYILAGQPEQALEVVARAGGLFIWPHEGLSRLRIIMELFDEAFILSNPLLSMIQALLHVKKGNVFEARRIFDATVGPLHCDSRPWDGDPDAPLARDRLVMESLLSIYEGREIADNVCDALEECARRLTPEDGSVALGQHCTILCVAYLQRGNFAKARHYAELGLPAFFAGGSLFGALYLYFHLGDISFSEGDGAQAEHYYKAAMELARRHFSDDQDIKLAASIFMTELNFETGNDGTAYRNVANIPIQLERHEAWFDIYAAGYATVAHLEYAQCGLEASLAVVEQAFAYAGRHRLDRLEKLLTGLWTELLIKADQIDTAREVLDASEIDIIHYRDADFTQVAWRERFVVVPAIIRLLVREGRYDEAQDHLVFFTAQAGHAGHRRALLKFEILGAVTGDLAGHEDTVMEHLDNAVALYRDSGFIRDFLNEAPRMTQLVERYIEQMAGASAKHQQRAAAREIVERLKKEEAGVDEVVQLLSDREIEVLQQLSHGYSNKLIGRKMDVSDSTVRFHLRNIFAKLNVKSRLQAVSVAQRRRLI
ncbi:LuxR C-terminal-related transcriptional regulator [Kineobactrum salinum]